MIQRIEAPKANPEKLLAIIEEAHRGKIVLPEFQRSFVWRRENIEELLASILQGYFIGTFLVLDTAPENSIFPFRLIEGLETLQYKAANHSTIRIVLDGQQRITSIFYALYEPKIKLANSQNPYRFYLILDNLMDGNPDDAVRGVSLADRRRLSEMESMEQAGKAIRISLFRDSKIFYNWLYSEQNKLNKEEKEVIEAFYRRFDDFMVPVVSVSPETGKENIINIFERINRTGISLSLFDLAVARGYTKNINLRKLLKEFHHNNQNLKNVVLPEFILKVISLIQGKEARKSVLLGSIDELDKSAFENLWKQACASLKKAYERITAPNGYGAFNNNLIPYSTLLVPLAALLHYVEKNYGGEAMYRKIDRWYWSSIFSKRYDQAVDSTTYRDVCDVKAWIEGKECPRWIENFANQPLDLKSVEDKKSAIYKGIMNLIVLVGAKDFINGQPANLKECHDDHIFPKSQFQNEKMINCILNRTLISKISNEIKSSKKPSEYLPLFLKAHDNNKERLKETLLSHFITEEAWKAMEQNDFNAFIEAREKALTEEINRRIKGE